MTFDQIVMAGLDPAIYAIEPEKSLDHRVKPGDDDYDWRRRA
jgi:hypothetical protein